MDHPESQTAGVLQTLKSFLTDPDELINILPTLEISFIYISVHYIIYHSFNRCRGLL